MNEELNYTIKNMHAVQYVPSMVRFHNKGRATSAFLYILEGSFLYKTAEGQKKAERGDTVYLPLFSEYSYEIVSGKAECIYVEFILEAEEDGAKRTEPICSSPTVLNRGDKLTLQSLFYEILAHLHTERFIALADLHWMISLLLRQTKPADNTHLGKIAPAVHYIRENYTDPQAMSAERIASHCGLSISHFRNLFKHDIGMTLPQYINQTKLSAAVHLLETTDTSASFAARIVNIPEGKEDTQIYARCYYVFEKDGQEIVIYGDIVSNNYAAVIG